MTFCGGKVQRFFFMIDSDPNGGFTPTWMDAVTVISVPPLGAVTDENSYILDQQTQDQMIKQLEDGL